MLSYNQLLLHTSCRGLSRRKSVLYPVFPILPSYNQLSYKWSPVYLRFTVWSTNFVGIREKLHNLTTLLSLPANPYLTFHRTPPPPRTLRPWPSLHRLPKSPKKISMRLVSEMNSQTRGQWPYRSAVRRAIRYDPLTCFLQRKTVPISH